MNTYILTWEPYGGLVSSNQVDAFVTSHRLVVSWFRAFSGTYVFKSEATISELSKSMRLFFGDMHFFVAALSPRFSGGTLPQTVWDWINTDRLPDAALLTPPQGGR